MLAPSIWRIFCCSMALQTQSRLSENVVSSSVPAEIKPELKGRAPVLFREGPRMGEKAELDY